MASIPRTPRVTGNLKDDVSVLQQWLNQLKITFESVKSLPRTEALASVEPLTLTISNPPTQAEVTLVLNKLNQVINAART